MAPKRQSLMIPATLVIVGGVAFGSLFAANKMAIDAGFPFIAYTFWQSLFAGLALLIVALVRSDAPKLTVPHLRQYLLMSVLGCQSALNIDPLSACNVDPFGDARRRSYR